MTEESTIQCEACGTLYSDIEEVCPYCGEPQPSLDYYEDEFMLDPVEHDVADDEYLPADEPLPDEAYDEGYEEAYDKGYDEGYEEGSEEAYADEPLYDDDLYPDETYLDEAEVPSRASELNAYAPPLEEEPLYEDHFEDEAGDEAGMYGDVDGPYPDEEYAADDLYNETDEDEEEATVAPRRFGWKRMTLGCLGLLVCISTFYGGLGVLAAYHGLQERAVDIETQAQTHYERGQTELEDGDIERAIAEFEQAIKLDPSLLPAREALHDARAVVQSQPTPTSETRLAAAVELLEQAETEVEAENWADALETLSEIRDLDPDYEPDRVSALFFEVDYELGLQAIDPDTMLEALTYFERALEESPDDSQAQIEQAKAALYVDGQAALDAGDTEAALDAFNQLHREDDDYLDVEALLARTYERFGDELEADDEWCLAELQYLEASDLRPRDDLLRTKAEDSGELCEESPRAQPTRAASSSSSATGTNTGSQAEAADDEEETAAGQNETAASTSAGNTAAAGSIYYSLYNLSESEWQILSVPANGNGSSQVIVGDATMPAVSPNGQLLAYRSEAKAAEGFHIYDMTSGEDRRVTILRQDILPRWGGNNNWFIFVAQEPATNRWRVQQGFADGRGDPQILRDGRTPDLSPNNDLIAYQGTDAEGNNPGIYVVPFGGGNASRLTTHESDRAPDFSPNGNQIAYMSTQSGSWDIYIVGLDDSSPRRLTTGSSNEGLPTWSPDGTKIAYVSDRGGTWGIYTIDVGGGEPTRVTGWDGSQRENWLLSQIEWSR